MTKGRVSVVIAQCGRDAGILVRQGEVDSGTRPKFASAHDLRRSFAERLIDVGVSAETLTVVMRNENFETTRRYYGARREAQAAGTECVAKVGFDAKSPFVGGLMGGLPPNAEVSEQHR